MGNADKIMNNAKLLKEYAELHNKPINALTKKEIKWAGTLYNFGGKKTEEKQKQKEFIESFNRYIAYGPQVTGDVDEDYKNFLKYLCLFHSLKFDL